MLIKGLIIADAQRVVNPPPDFSLRADLTNPPQSAQLSGIRRPRACDRSRRLDFGGAFTELSGPARRFRRRSGRSIRHIPGAARNCKNGDGGRFVPHPLSLGRFAKLNGHPIAHFGLSHRIPKHQVFRSIWLKRASAFSEMISPPVAFSGSTAATKNAPGRGRPCAKTL
jgi:hypothetical protein